MADGEPDRPDWLDDRFESPEELAKSYRELEGRFTRSQQEISGMRTAQEELYDQFEEMQTALAEQQEQYQQPMPSQGAEEYSPLIAMYEQARDSGDIRQELMAQAALTRSLWERWNAEQQAQRAPEQDPNSEAVAQLFAMQTEQLVKSQIPDWDEIKGGVAEVIDANPELLKETNEPLRAAQMVRNAAAVYRQQQLELAAQGGGNQVEPSRQAKLQAQTMQAQGLHPGTNEPTAEQWWNEVKNSPTGGFRL